MTDRIIGETIYVFEKPTSDNAEIIKRAGECAKKREAFEAHGKLWNITLIEVVDGKKVTIEGLEISAPSE